MKKGGVGGTYKGKINLKRKVIAMELVTPISYNDVVQGALLEALIYYNTF